MKSRLKRVWRIFFALLCVCILINANTAYAGGQLVCRCTVADEESLKAYIEGVSDGDGAKYQIGNVPVEDPVTYSITEDDEPMRTLIMLDNSLSIPKDDREDIQALMKEIVDRHSDNETFRIATFSGKQIYLSDSYSSDYTAVKNVIDSINYTRQGTFLTDVVSSVIDDINEEGYMGFTRIIIISDGMDNNSKGITREEITAKLSETPYPIYAIGVKKGDNEQLLKSMYSLSRITNSTFWDYSKNLTQDMFSILAKDSELTVFWARIPQEAKVGGRQSSKLTLPNGQEVVFDVKMPFAGVGELQENENIEVQSEVEKAEQFSVEKKSSNFILILMLIFFGLIIVGCGVVFIILAIKKKKKKGLGQSADVSMQMIAGEDKTEMVDGAVNENVAVLFGDESARVGYRLVLTDKNAPSRTFQCALNNAVTIGRAPENDIVLNYDKSVSSKHCMITSNNGRFFIQDLGSANRTYINGKQVVSSMELVSGSTVKMGRVELIAKFERVY